MDSGLVFGWRTAVLSVAFVQLLVLAALLTRPLRNRTANLTLSSLVIVLAGIITPWMIGFAGFYDRWPWLTFAPFGISLSVAPLCYLYVHSLVTQQWPAKGWMHLIPAILQFAYLAAMFLLLRQPMKNEWLVESTPTYDAITGAGVILGLAYYAAKARVLIAGYRDLLSRQRSDDDRFALSWTETTILALFVLLTIWASYGIWNIVSPLSYRGLMGLYVSIASFALFLGIGGWRLSSTLFPTIGQLRPRDVSSRDWNDKAASWLDRVRRDRLYADPELSVPKLARLLGTNSAYVSRAFNEGLGANFSTIINRLRSEEVAAAIRLGSDTDLLTQALASGFSSKASFNRAFKDRFHCSPSAYRREQVSNSKNLALEGN